MPTHQHLHSLIGATPESDFELAELVEKGIPTDSISYLRGIGLTFSELSAVVISPRTLKHRKARGERLSHEETERVLRVARILALAEQVFANPEKALLWLRMPDNRLNTRTPFSMLTTEAGGHVVESMLWQIDEGIYS